MCSVLANAVIVIAILAATGCEKSGSESAPLPLPTPTNDGLSVLSVGDGDLRLLRYRFVKGTHSTLDLAMDVDLDAAGRTSPLPRLVLGMRIEVAAVRPSGEAELRTTITEARFVDRPGASPAANVAQAAEMLVGVVHQATLSPDGAMREVRIDAATPNPAMAQELAKLTSTLEQLAMRLPPVPVGVGSTWVVTKQTAMNALRMTTVTTFELTSIDGDRIGYTSQTTLSAADQKIVQGGAEIEMTDLGGGGTSRGTFDLAKVSVIGDIGLEFRGTAKIGEQRAKTEMKMQLRLSERGR